MASMKSPEGLERFRLTQVHPKCRSRIRAIGIPSLAMCGRLPVGKGFLDGDAELVGAAMCPACLCGADLWPLAIMLSADQVPINNTQSKSCIGSNGVS